MPRFNYVVPPPKSGGVRVATQGRGFTRAGAGMQQRNGIEEEGIEAFIYFQKLAGEDKGREAALLGWRVMTPTQKSVIMSAYRIMKSLEKREKGNSGVT